MSSHFVDDVGAKKHSLLKEASHENWAWKVLLWRCVLACVPCPIFDPCAFFFGVAGARDSALLEGQTDF